MMCNYSELSESRFTHGCVHEIPKPPDLFFLHVSNVWTVCRVLFTIDTTKNNTSSSDNNSSNKPSMLSDHQRRVIGKNKDR